MRKLQLLIGKIYNSYKNMKLTRKLSLLFILGWFFPMLFSSTYIYQKITDHLIKFQIDKVQEDHNQVASFLSYRMNSITATCRIIAMDSIVNEILSRSSQDYAHSEQMRDMSRLRVYLSQFQNIHQDDLLRLYVPDGRIYSNENKLFYNLNNIKDTLWYKKSFKGWGWITYAPPGTMDNPNFISIACPIRDFNNYRSIIGMVKFDIPLKDIEQILIHSNINSDCLTYLATSNGMIVGASSYNLLSIYALTDKDKNELASAEEKFITMQKKGEKIWIYASKVEPTDWSLITVLPEKALINRIHTLQWQYIIITVLLFFVVILINLPYINSIPRRLNELIKNMKRVQTGDLSAKLHTASGDEIGQLIDNFNFMLESIKDLMEQQYILGQEKKTAELKALQSQINPHFLYNTLEMIGWLAYDGTPEEIHSVVRSLAEFFRLSLNKGNDITTIEYELQLVKSYMHIQDFRFKNRITLQIDINDIHNYIIPKITLQPLVENAIIHGILEKPNKQGVVKVYGGLNSDGMVELSVEDDGVGMDAEQLDKIKKGKLPSSDGSGYGLDNIEKRICLFFGIERSLYFQSQPDKGTRITLVIPAIPYNQYKNMENQI